MTTDRPDLDAIEAEANATTPGPWTANYDEDNPPDKSCGAWACVGFPAETTRHGVFLDWEPSDSDPTYEWSANESGNAARDDQARTDCRFIASARSTVPALIAYARRLEARIAELEASQIVRPKAWFDE